MSTEVKGLALKLRKLEIVLANAEGLAIASGKLGMSKTLHKMVGAVGREAEGWESGLLKDTKRRERYENPDNTDVTSADIRNHLSSRGDQAG